MTTIVTGFSPSGLIEYGQNFMNTFDRFWPKRIHLMVYVEETTEVPRSGMRWLWSCAGAQDFIERHRKIAKHCGREEFAAWRPKDRGKPYAYRWDAVKFCRQLFIPEQAATELPDGEILAWLDGDVVSHAPVPEILVDKLVGNNDLIFLGRVAMHTELGFWAVRLSPRTRGFLAELADIYRSDRVFNLREWHSAFVFDHVRTQNKKLRQLNLTPHGRGHVWFQSPMARYTDHLKGDRRKARGHSLERKIS